jgi:nitrate reductase gamma subunit
MTLLALAYVSLVVFTVVSLIRTVGMLRQPVHLRWELAPVAHEKGKSHYGGSYFENFEWWTEPRGRSLASEAAYMFQEIVFLKAVWEHHRRLWWFSFPFHLGMYLAMTAGLLHFAGAVLGLMGWSTADWGWLRTAVVALAGTGFALGAFGTLGLIGCRLFDPRLRAFGTGMGLLNLSLLLAIFLTGGWALIGQVDFPGRLTAFVQALLTADTSVVITGALAAHLVLFFAFLAYMPLTPMFHFVAKYFTYHRVRWDDEAMTPGSPLEKKVLKLLDQPVTWSGPHLKADGKKNWVDIAIGDTGDTKE